MSRYLHTISKKLIQTSTFLSKFFLLYNIRLLQLRLCCISNTLRQTGKHTSCRLDLTEKFNEATMTIWFVVLLLEGALIELLEAEGTDKMLRVELLAHRRDAPACYGLLTARAERATSFMVVNLTVWLPIVFKEAAAHERGKTLLQYTHRKLKIL